MQNTEQLMSAIVKLLPISIEIYATLNAKDEWTKEEEYWHRQLKEILIHPTE